MLLDQASSIGKQKLRGISINFEPRAERRADDGYVIQFPDGSQIEPWRIWFSERQVCCGDSVLDLARSPAILRLFKAFCDDRQPVIKREALLYLVYGKEHLLGCSERMLVSKRANCVKMISRARAMAAKSLSRPFADLVEWFPYDYGSKSWHLIGLRRPWLH